MNDRTAQPLPRWGLPLVGVLMLGAVVWGVASGPQEQSPAPAAATPSFNPDDLRIIERPDCTRENADAGLVGLDCLAVLDAREPEPTAEELYLVAVKAMDTNPGMTNEELLGFLDSACGLRDTVGEAETMDMLKALAVKNDFTPAVAEKFGGLTATAFQFCDELNVT